MKYFRKLRYVIVAMVAFSFVSCADEGIIATSDQISNQTNSEITIELEGTEQRVIKIQPGEIKMIHSAIYYHDMGERPEITLHGKVLVHLNPKMIIDGNTVSESIWMRDYWRLDVSDVSNPAYLVETNSLIVTNELIEEINNQ